MLLPTGVYMFGSPAATNWSSGYVRAPTTKSNRLLLSLHGQPKPDIDQDFENLRNEFKKPSGSNNSDQMRSKSKEWVDRSYHIFSEINRDVAATTYEQERNQKMLVLQKKWANKMIDLAAEFGTDLMVELKDPTRKSSYTTNRNHPSISKEPLTNQYHDRTNHEVIVPPRYNIKDDTTAFQVELQVPGLNLESVDVYVETDTNVLVICGTIIGPSIMDTNNNNNNVLPYMKRFRLESGIHMIDAIVATQQNGILTIRAPKLLPPSSEPKNHKKIPILSKNDQTK